MGEIFSLSDTEDLSLKERASLILGEASREARRQLDDALDPDSVLQPVSFEKTIRQRTCSRTASAQFSQDFSAQALSGACELFEQVSNTALRVTKVTGTQEQL